MGLLTNLKNNIANSYNEKKAAAQQDKAYVRNNIGSTAIAEFIAAYFGKGAPLYNWVKDNHQGIEFRTNAFSIDVYYTYSVRNPQGFRDAMPKKEVICTFSFDEMYRWYGCTNQGAFSRLTTKTQMNELYSIIIEHLNEIPHIKYANGWTVRMFQ